MTAACGTVIEEVMVGSEKGFSLDHSILTILLANFIEITIGNLSVEGHIAALKNTFILQGYYEVHLTDGIPITVLSNYRFKQ